MLGLRIQKMYDIISEMENVHKKYVLHFSKPMFTKHENRKSYTLNSI